jgi:hypothetical protein
MYFQQTIDVCSPSDPNWTTPGHHHHWMENLVTYAKKVEKELFESAHINNNIAYCHMFTEKIKEVQEKKNRRLNERQLQQDHNSSNKMQEQKKIDWDNMAEALLFLDDLKKK